MDRKMMNTGPVLNVRGLKQEKYMVVNFLIPYNSYTHQNRTVNLSKWHIKVVESSVGDQILPENRDVDFEYHGRCNYDHDHMYEHKILYNPSNI